MEICYNVMGTRRKKLVDLIAETTGAKAVYQFMPTCSYVIDYFTVTKDGILIFDDRADSEEVERVLEAIAAAGFACKPTCEAESAGEELSDESETAPHSAIAALTVEIPADKVNVDNLAKLLEAKGGLIKKALGVDALPVEVGKDSVSFPWFGEVDSDAAKAYLHFIAALCEMSRNVTRVTAVERPKYAFRCFLLRLGFIGAEYKAERKILLRNLSGSSAFRNGGTSDSQETECN